MKQLHLDVPQVTLLAHELRKNGMRIPQDILTVQELVDAVADSIQHTGTGGYIV